MWLKDTTGQPSVSLTLMLVSFVVLLVIGVLDICSVVKSTGIFLELFLTTVGLYFGRRVNFKGQTFGTDGAKGEEAK